MKKRGRLLFAAALLTLSGMLLAPNISQSCAKASVSDYVEGEALVTVKVSKEMRSSPERNKLFASLCSDIAKSVSADIYYTSPIYSDSENGTAFMRSKLKTEEIISLLLKDKNILGASPNYIRKINSPPSGGPQ